MGDRLPGAVDGLLSKMNFDRVSVGGISVLLSVLSVTRADRDKLPSRAKFLSKVEQFIIKIKGKKLARKLIGNM
jgi:hypothetical protein